MTLFQVLKTCLLVIILTMLYQRQCLSQSLGDLIDYAVVPSCESPDPNKPTEIGKYYLQLKINSLSTEEGDFDISIDGNSIFQFHIETNDLPYNRFIGPFNHSGVGGSYHEYVIRSLEQGGADTLFLPEVVCGISTSNGLNGAGYFCDHGSYGLVAQVAPEVLNEPQLPEKTYVYVLIERETGLTVDRNFSGQFGALDDLTNYEVHAFAIPFDRQAEFINDIAIGEPLDQNDLDICFALCGIYSLLVDCSSFDLSLEKSVQGGFVYSIGDLVVFDIIVNNDGRVTAYDVVVTDHLPDALTFLPDQNPYWISALESYPIDSILAGSSMNIPLFTRVNSLSSEIDILNSAEITFAASEPGNDHPAFDVDSTPDNDDEDEDDHDDAEIIILENLCQATFDIEADNEPVCEGSDIVMMARIAMASFPLRYRWRKDGDIVSRDSIFTIENHTAEDYGEYSLTIIDNNGCSGTEYIEIEPIDNENRFSCFSNINVGVSSTCEIFLLPSMFTSRPVSAIDDYLIELRDEQNNLVDPSDLSAYLQGAVLEARIINPCTMETICWSNLNIEQKGLPTHDIYSEEVFSLSCHKVLATNPSDIIEVFNNQNDEAILSAEEFQEKFNQQSCIQEWLVHTLDDILEPSTDCSDRTVRRIYYVFDQEIQVPVDTVRLMIHPILSDSLVMPEDIHNLSCIADIDPKSLGSFPAISMYGVSEPLIPSNKSQNGSICNLGISYSDQVFDQSCNYGSYKIIRHWTATDWCANTFYEDLQYLFIVDDLAPEIFSLNSAIEVTAAPFECVVSIDIFDYLTNDDLCDPNPVVSIINHTNPHQIKIPIGQTEIRGKVSDKCGNSTPFELIVNVVEYSPPVAILKQNLTLSLTQDDIVYTNFLSVDFVDAGSHDSDCGPVSLLMARSTEALLVELHFNRFPVEDNLKNCSDDLSNFDEDSDGYINRKELFRKEISFCCQDIGSTVELIVQVQDQSGNITEARTLVFVDAKLEWTMCNDNDPCTIDDRQYGDCPCIGVPYIEDFDQDNILDCMDDLITVCLDNVQREVPLAELEDLVKQGAIGGPCEGIGQMASVAGEVFTRKGEMIEDVLVTMSNSKKDLTKSDGYYRFDQNEMYQYYELYPERDDDPINGVSTLDLVLLQEFILMKREINDPYLLIAADANNDGKISALDIVELRKLLLGSNHQFYNNRSWRFVIENFEFEDIRNPYDYQETNVIFDLDTDKMNENWIGIKIGDLNDSAIPNGLKAKSRSDEKWIVEIPNLSIKKGEEIQIPISSKNKDVILGLQLSLKLENLTFVSFSSGDLEVESNQYSVQSKSFDRLNIVWHSNNKVVVSDELFYLTLKVNEDGELEDMLSLDQWNIDPLVAQENYTDITLGLEFVDDNSLTVVPKAELYQNQPNPFNGETIIQFFIPEGDIVKIAFYDTNGKLLLNTTNHYSKGVNAMRLTHNDLSLFEGIVYYQLQYKDQTTSRIMVATNIKIN